MSDGIPDAATRRLLERVIEIDAAERAAWLERACPEDPDRRRTVLDLLATGEWTLGRAAERVRVGGPPPEPGDRIGPYVLEEAIGTGASSEVWRARQVEPFERTVALKLLRIGTLDRATVERLGEEKQLLARMSHPAVATVFDAAVTEEGRPYLAMELVPGRPVTRFADEERLALAERIGLVLEACEAVQHAHGKGLVHRDLKPANLLAFRDDAGRARLKVIDFGIARALAEEGDAGPADLATFAGTPAYMAPEQAGAIDADVDARTDVHALGTVLHELLSSGRPFAPARPAGTDTESLRTWLRSRVTRPPSDDPARPGWRRALRTDLDWIVERCLRVDPGERYPSPGALAEDLRRFLAGEPVSARPATAAYRLRKLAARNPLATAAGAGLVLALAGGAAVATDLAVAERAARRQAERERTAFERIAEAQAVAYEGLDPASIGEAIVARLGRQLEEAGEDGPGPVEGVPAHEAFAALASWTNPADAAAGVIDEQFLAPAEQAIGSALDGLPYAQWYVTFGIGQSRLDLGLEERALADAERALGFARALGEDGGVPVARTGNLAVRSLLMLERADEAEQRAIPLLEEARRRLGPDHETTLVLEFNRILAVQEQGRHEEARDRWQAHLERVRAVHGDDSAAATDVRRNLARSYERTGDAERAFELKTRVHQWRTANLDPDDPLVVNAGLDLGITAYRLERYAEALEWIDRAIEDYARTVGADHPWTGNAGGIRCRTLGRLGRHDEAIAELGALRSRMRRVHGDDHWVCARLLEHEYELLVEADAALVRAGEAPRHAERAAELKAQLPGGGEG